MHLDNKNVPLLAEWLNGNATVSLYENGTRIIDYPDEEGLILSYPLNLDIRVSSQCAFGLNEKTGKSICTFCHESATTKGKEADYAKLKSILAPLPEGIELAIGVNQFTADFFDFLEYCKSKKWTVNATVNQGLIFRDKHHIAKCLDSKLIHGLGISYRAGMKYIPKQFVRYDNTVVHVIAGIDDISQVKDLANLGVRKILILGEKDFGFNKGNVDLNSTNHIRWYRQLHELFKIFEVVSFDNLALEQLNVRRFVRNWSQMYQGEHSFYINAVDGYFSPSSRSPERLNWTECSITDYFKQIDK